MPEGRLAARRLTVLGRGLGQHQIGLGPCSAGDPDAPAAHRQALHADIDGAYFREPGVNGSAIAAGAMLDWLSAIRGRC